MQTLADFYRRIEATRPIRRDVVASLLGSSAPPSAAAEALATTLEVFESACDPSLTASLRVGSRTFPFDLTYEVRELRRDLALLHGGPSGLRDELAHLHPGFDREVERLRHRLSPTPRFHAFVTDRDGTINNYCGRYRSSIQGAYNALALARFAAARAEHAVIMTAAPLRDPGVATVSVLPAGTFVYAASKGREFEDLQGRRHAIALEPAVAGALDAVFEGLEQLLGDPADAAFGWVGTGLQRKCGEIAIARQTHDGLFASEASERFARRVRDLVDRIDPGGDSVEVVDTGLDLEIVGKSDRTRAFSKADGLAFVASTLEFELDRGTTLMCGDTAGDLPLLRACLDHGGDVRCVFVTGDAALRAEVTRLCPDALFVDAVDILVGALNELALDVTGRRA